MHKRHSVHCQNHIGQFEVDLSTQQGRSIKDVWLPVGLLVYAISAAGCVWLRSQLFWKKYTDFSKKEMGIVTHMQEPE